MKFLSEWAIPLFILAVLASGQFKGVKVYETFLQGAEEGLKTGIGLFPIFLAIFGGIAVFRASGALALLCQLGAPLGKLFRIPREILPLGLIKPLSGSGTLGLMIDLVQKHGADSLLGTMAALVAGCSETTFYVLTVYLGAIKINRPKHLLLMGLLGDFAAFLTAVFIARWFLG